MWNEKGLNYAKIVRNYIVTIVSVVIVCVLSLYLAGLVPQLMLKDNYISSAKQIESEGVFPHVFNLGAYNSRLDNHTEAIIIMSAYYMDTAASPEMIIYNPFIRKGVEEMTVVANDDSYKPDSFYFRYWEGFRVILRPLLAIFDYGEIRTLMTLAFYSLLVICTLFIAKHSTLLTGLSFMLSILSLNTPLIANSIQFISCFFISFFFILFVPRVKKAGRQYYPLFFALSGILTQYFDFYTAPLLTLGMPLVFLVVLHMKEREGQKKRRILRLILTSFLSWLLAYGAMWFLKLWMISIFTSHNGFEAGIASFIWRTGIRKDENFMESYNVLLANLKAFAALISTNTLGIAMAATWGTFALVLLVKMIRMGKVHVWLQKSWPFFILALFPIAWFCAAAQPTSIHYWFQYRPLGITVFSILVIYSNAISLVWPRLDKKVSIMNI